MSESTERENPWHKLWGEVIDADCWDDEGHCRFCGMHFSENHKADCPFDRADTMMAEEIWNEWIHELSEKENVEPHNPWRELWVEWFDYSGEPCEEICPGGALERTCFFCGNQRGHCPSCVYLKAKQLLDKEAR